MPIDISSFPPGLQTAAIIGTILAFFVMAILGYRTRYNVVGGADDGELRRLQEQLAQQKFREELRKEFTTELKALAQEADHSYAELDERVRALELSLASALALGVRPKPR